MPLTPFFASIFTRRAPSGREFGRPNARRSIPEIFEHLADGVGTARWSIDHVVVLSRPYWDYPPLLAALRAPDLVPVEAVDVDGVPFWILYRRQVAR